MENNKGQVLVTFILFLPVLILLIGIVYEIGNIGFTKKQAQSSIKDAISYGLKNMNNENVIDDIDNIVIKNIKNIKEKQIDINEQVISIKLIVQVDGIFNKLFNDNLYNITLKYSGYIENNKIKIREW